MSNALTHSGVIGKDGFRRFESGQYLSELGWYRRLYSLSQAFEPGTYFFERMKRKMKLDKLVGERFKEKPSDCVIDSHALMLRGGYMRMSKQ